MQAQHKKHKNPQEISQINFLTSYYDLSLQSDIQVFCCFKA